MVGLRASLIWNDEVMEDFVLDRPKDQSKAFKIGLRIILVMGFMCGVSYVLQHNVELYERLVLVGGSTLLILLSWKSEKRAPSSVTIGSSGDATFTLPDVGLPAGFAFLRAGNRGYLLTLGTKMRGTICLDGETRHVDEFVRRGGEGEGTGEFRATPISGKDWGLVELDDSGMYKVFFQFVPVDEPQQFLTPKTLAAGLIGLAISTLTITCLWIYKGLDVDESVFRGFGMAATATIAGLGVIWLGVQDGETQASFTFSVMLHAFLLYMTYVVYNGINPFVYPGSPDLTGQYIKSRLDVTPPEEEKPKETVSAVNKQEAAAKSPEKPANTATKNDQGASGGKGDTERARTTNPNPDKGDPPKVAFFEDKNRKYIDNILDRNLSTSLSKFNGVLGDANKAGSSGYGHGTGHGVGDDLNGFGTTRGSKGKGTGGGGNAEGDFVTNKGPIDTGKNRPGGTCVGPNCKGTGPREVSVKLEEPTGDFNGLSKEEIDRVVKARAGIFRACYQKELNHTPGLGGKLIMHFVIAADGGVTTASTAGGSLRNAGVEDCINNNIMRLKFPAKGGAIVNYPFVFSQGG